MHPENFTLCEVREGYLHERWPILKTKDVQDFPALVPKQSDFNILFKMLRYFSV
jgi:hypothetical protein